MSLFRIERADAIDWLKAQPNDSIDLLFTSPPYLEARTYGEKLGKPLDEWVPWMVEVVKAAAPKVTGLIGINCEGQTRDFQYLPAPFLLAADLHRAGFNLRKPLAFHRVGIPGSGGPDWFRNDWEPVICITRPGKLPWSDPTACGHAPKWAPGGEMSHRLTDGSRQNQWGKGAKNTGTGSAKAIKSTSMKRRPAHRIHTKREANGKMLEQNYVVPAIANPGNVIKFNVGGGQMGHPIAHTSEAPFPLKLAEVMVRSFSPPGGVVADPFMGSGTVLHAAIANGRIGIGCDIRQSQVDNTRRRLRTVTPQLPGVHADV